MYTEYLPVKEIKSNDKNPRNISDENYEKLKKSIVDFPEMLETRPLITDENNTVIGGNMRLKVLQDLGYTEVPVKKVSWSEEKKKEFIIKDNVAFGEWDWEKLANEWDDLPLAEWGVDVENVEISLDETEDLEEPEVEVTEEDLQRGKVRSVVFLFDENEYVEVQERLKKVREKYQVENNTEVLNIMLKEVLNE